MARNKRNTDRFSSGKGKPSSLLSELQFHPLPAQWMLLTDAKGTSTFLTGPILLAGTNPQLPMKKQTPNNVVPLLDDETKTSVRNLLFGPKVLKRLAILARLARGTKPSDDAAPKADDERLAA